MTVQQLKSKLINCELKEIKVWVDTSEGIAILVPITDVDIGGTIVTIGTPRVDLPTVEPFEHGE